MDYAHPNRKPIWHCWSVHGCRQHQAGATRGQGDLQPVQRRELAFGTVDPVVGIGSLRVARTASKIPTSSLTYGFGRPPSFSTHLQALGATALFSCYSATRGRGASQ